MILRVGVVGVGTMGQHHVRVYTEIDNCELVGIFDKDAERAKEIASKYGTKTFGSLEDLIKIHPDAVSIAVPTSLHKEVAIKFLKEGIACLIEKPISATIEDAQEIIDAAEESGTVLMVGHIERFNPAVLKLKDLITKGELGNVLVLSARRVGPQAPRIMDVGIIIDLATHDIDVVRFLIGREPKEIYARYGSYHWHKEDYALILLDFEKTIACIEANWFTPYKVRTLIATGTNAIANLNYIDQTIEINSSKVRQIVEVNKKEPLKVELEHFIECVREGKRPLVDGYEGLKNLKIAITALEKGAN
jgi:UDP-N-acetylglucosamine 3-dehydrogenase